MLHFKCQVDCSKNTWDSSQAFCQRRRSKKPKKRGRKSRKEKELVVIPGASAPADGGRVHRSSGKRKEMDKAATLMMKQEMRKQPRKVKTMKTVSELYYSRKSTSESKSESKSESESEEDTQVLFDVHPHTCSLQGAV